MVQEKLRTFLRKIHVWRNYKDRFFLRCFQEKEDLLTKNREEVYHMILTEFNEKAYKKYLYQDGVKDGIEQGLQRGLQQGMQRGLQQGMQQGMEHGISVMINLQQEQGGSSEATKQLIKDKFSLEDTEAKMYMQKYWK